MPNELSLVIQGGMGVGVSGWRLAAAVSTTGQLGVVSGTALDAVLVRRLQLGDKGGHIRRALAAFPVPGVAAEILERYFLPDGKRPHVRFRSKSLLKINPSRRLTDLMVASNFVEVYLAKERHGNPVGINYLEKIQLPTLASLYGALLAGVDYVLMGAGIPRAIPRVLDRLTENLKTGLRIDVKDGSRTVGEEIEFDPVEYTRGQTPSLRRPRFLPIVSSQVLATMLARGSETGVDGFIVEAPTAGGHNAPPRGKLVLNDTGEPTYGEKDAVDLEAMHSLGLPFWLAGSRADPLAVRGALQSGASGVQVGTVFAFCEESGLDPELKRRAHSEHHRRHSPSVHRSFRLAHRVSVQGFGARRFRFTTRRVCTTRAGLRPGLSPQCLSPRGRSVGWRCPAEPEADYVAKGGSISDTEGANASAMP